ncbi:MAG: hypothetical protein AVDCRST_MAG08-943, partial [uncultured Acetobacteraceae bacterium]
GGHRRHAAACGSVHARVPLPHRTPPPLAHLPARAAVHARRRL